MNETFYFFPKLILAIGIFGIGWLITSWAAKSTSRSPHHEDIPRASLIARVIKAILIMFFLTMALVELEIARQLVIIGFVIIFVSLCILMIVLVVMGGREFIQKMKDSSKEKP
jgi:high-affinity Fe2+/Pb2+ permease